jgi:hypothetical protein
MSMYAIHTLYSVMYMYKKRFREDFFVSYLWIIRNTMTIVNIRFQNNNSVIYAFLKKITS